MTIYLRNLTFIPMQEWAKQTLTPNELEQFNIALEINNQLWKSYKENNIINNNYTEYESFLSESYNTNISIPTVEVIQIAEGQTVPMAPEIVPWVDRYNQDNGDPIIIESANNQ